MVSATPKSVFRILMLALIFYLDSCEADDAFQCCMGGWKSVGDIELCQMPCCPGYREVVEKPPLLRPVVLCKKLANGGKDFERLINLSNDLHSYWQRRK